MIMIYSEEGKDKNTHKTELFTLWNIEVGEFDEETYSETNICGIS